jgi:hypothetical protein
MLCISAENHGGDGMVASHERMLANGPAGPLVGGPDPMIGDDPTILSSALPMLAAWFLIMGYLLLR